MMAALAVAPGVIEPVAVAHRLEHEIEGADGRADPFRDCRSATPALASAAIIMPFQSASTLSSRSGGTRFRRAASSISRCFLQQRLVGIRQRIGEPAEAMQDVAALEGAFAA